MTRILVIEDNPTNLELMSYLLEAWGHEVLTATDGDAGLAAARTQRPELVVCDIQMPGTDGYGVARALKADPATAVLPLIAVTAYAMVGDQEKALQAGFDAHFPKPIEPSAFMSAIAPFLSGAGATRAPAPAPVTTPAVPGGQVRAELRAPRAGVTLLMVDDTATNLEFKLSLLEPAGYTVLTATGGREAVHVLRAQHVDLVVSDVMMASGSGFDLLAAVRSTPALRHLPFVFLTATARDDRTRRHGIAMGADDFLVRPIEPEELLAAIRARLAP